MKIIPFQEGEYSVGLPLDDIILVVEVTNNQVDEIDNILNLFALISDQFVNRDKSSICFSSNVFHTQVVALG